MALCNGRNQEGIQTFTTLPSSPLLGFSKPPMPWSSTVIPHLANFDGSPGLTTRNTPTLSPEYRSVLTAVK